MMIYRKKNRGKKIRVILFASFLALIFILGYFQVGFFHDIVRSAMTPFVKIQSIIGTPFRNIGAYFSSKEFLANQIRSLTEERDELRVQTMQLELLRIENSELRSLSEGSIHDAFVLAKVLVHPPRSPYDTFVIDKGSDAGLVSGSAVFYKDILLGHVLDASGGASVVKLITSSGVETGVRIKGEFDGTAVGKGGGRMSITLPKDTPIQVGDVVTVPDETSSIVGTVSHIEVSDIDSFQMLYIALPISISSISFVEVEK